MTVNDGEALQADIVSSMASLPLGTPVELEVIFEAAGQRRRDQCSVASPGGVPASTRLKLRWCGATHGGR